MGVEGFTFCPTATTPRKLWKMLLLYSVTRGTCVSYSVTAICITSTSALLPSCTKSSCWQHGHLHLVSVGFFTQYSWFIAVGASEAESLTPGLCHLEVEVFG